MRTEFFKTELNNLEIKVSKYFSELLQAQDEFSIFAEEDLEHDAPDEYLEMRNDITGNVFDVHPLKVTQDGILVVEADGTFVRHLTTLSNFSNVEDRIKLCELMEKSLT